MQKRTALQRPPDWDDLRYFLAIARTGSFTKAAAVLSTTQSTVGRRLHGLERRLGAKLFDRRYDGMRITPVGREVLGRVEAMERLAVEAERTLVGTDQELDGVVRIAATEGIGSYWLAPRLGEFQDRYPRVIVDILTGNEVLDLASRQADLAIRLAKPTDPKLVGVQVGVMRFGMFCAQSYIDQHGTPASLEEIATGHRLVDQPSYGVLSAWSNFLATRPTVVFRSNSSVAFTHAIAAGRGIGLLPLFSRFTAPGLVRLPVVFESSLPIWLVSHLETNRNAKTRALWDHVKALFQRDQAEWFS